MTRQPDLLVRLGARRPNHSLEQDFYCAPEVLKADLEHIWYREWLFTLPSCQRPKTGNHATLQIGA